MINVILPACPVCRTQVSKPISKWAKLSNPNKDYIMHYYTVGSFRCGNCKKEFEQALTVQLVQLVPVAKIKELESVAKKQQDRAEQLEKELAAVREENMKLTELYNNTRASLQDMQKKAESLNNELEIAGLDMKVKDLERDVISLEKERNLLQAKVAQLSPPEA